MTEDQIKYLVNRFLSWRLPTSFSPDGGIRYSRQVPMIDNSVCEMMPSGTNLLDSEQAREMVLYMFSGMPVEAVKPPEEPRGMRPKEAVDMMMRCKSEIAALRSQIEHLKPKAEAYDSVAIILSLLPGPSMGVGEDVVWTLDKRIRELAAPEAK